MRQCAPRCGMLQVVWLSASLIIFNTRSIILVSGQGNDYELPDVGRSAKL